MWTPVAAGCEYSVKSGLKTILKLHQGSWQYHRRITGGRNELGALLLHIDFSGFLNFRHLKMGDGATSE